MNIFSRITRTIFSSEIQRQVSLALTENDQFLVGSRSLNPSDRDRFDYDREQVQTWALEAWRSNPLARRIVELTSEYVVGGGITVQSKHTPTHKFLNAFCNHRLNHMHVRYPEMCDELTRTGNMFVLLTTDQGGMSYIRILPADQVKEIKSKQNDIEQVDSVIMKETVDHESDIYQSYDPQNDQSGETGKFSPVILHYAINRPAGAQWGESDLAPLIKWLSRYANWLEDRARLNRFRTSFLYKVTKKFQSEADRVSRQSQLNSNPPTPGSILVTDESEAWEVLSPKLESDQAGSDGLALKKMIAAGVGIPLHFLAEPESATRTTAEAAGGPTFRRFEQRQEFFTWILSDIFKVVVSRRALVDKKVSKTEEIQVLGADISARDNVSLAMAALNIVSAFKDLRDRKLIDDAEFLRMVYRFCGESVDIEEILRLAKKAPDPVLTGESAPRDPQPSQETQGKGNDPNLSQPIKIDPDTGEENPIPNA